MKPGSRTAELEEERKRTRKLRVLVDLVTSTLYQDRDLNLRQARQLVRKTEEAVLRLFPGKECTYQIVLLPRFERILRERWGRGLEDQIH